MNDDERASGPISCIGGVFDHSGALESYRIEFQSTVSYGIKGWSGTLARVVVVGTRRTPVEWTCAR